MARLPRLIRDLPGAEDGFQPNAVASCLVLFVPLQIALLWLPGSARLFPVFPFSALSATSLRVMQGCLLALTAGTLFLSQSRGAFIGLLVAAVMFMVCHGWPMRALLVAGLGAGTAWGLRRGPEAFLDRRRRHGVECLRPD